MINPGGIRPLSKRLTPAREAYFLWLDSLAKLPPDLVWPARRFTCLLLLDANSPASVSLSQFAEQLLRAGCVYLCAWGPGCEYVHDVFDDTIVGLEVHSGLHLGTVMTSWHSQESLSETVDFFARWAQPDEELKEDCDAAVAIAVARTDWAAEAERLLVAYAV
jgi:hypothetical protein